MRINRKSLMDNAALALAASAMLMTTAAVAQDADAPAPEAEPATVPATVDDRPIVAMGGPVGSYGSNVNPMKGLIRTFEGDLGPHVGRIRTFEGPIDPQKGLIRTFEGDIDPYKGLIRTFWGQLTPVAGELDPKVGRIRTFTDSFLPSSSAISAAWARAEQTGDYSEVVSLLNAMIGSTRDQWGQEVQSRTGRDFNSAVLNPFLAKWKVNLSNPASLRGWHNFNRQSFLLDWYDNVLNHSGMDRTDHWMNAVRWTPALTQVQGGGSKAVIGLIDFFAANDADVRSKVVYSGGYANVNNAHGAAVGSLIVASHDNRGIMGIAPRATIAAYNPFDSSMTASWRDVQTGIAAVGSRGASVINLSLGVPGVTLPAEWKNVFSRSEIDTFKDHTIYVIAAGNDGVVQTKNIDMTGALDSTFILVGSVDPFGRISAFSNTPGTACITVSGVCTSKVAWNTQDGQFATTDYLKNSGLLMNRFLVAPGELILVSDGAGGVTRMSGTSFAAPLVSGAIALIHDRWPWLKNHPRDVAKIILESAQDLGAPGVDPVYGHGLLDITAAQSALDFGKLVYYLVDGSNSNEVKADILLSKGAQSIWSTRNLYFTAFEKIDSAERDFLIPLSSRLFSKSVDGRLFQKHMHDLFMAWLNNGGGTGKFTSLSDSARVKWASDGNGWSYSMRGRYQTETTRHGFQPRFHSTFEVSSPEQAMSFAVGTGDGAGILGGTGAMQLASDFDPYLGGNDPLLGFASGGAHMAARVKLTPNLRVGLGLINTDRDIDNELSQTGQSVLALGKMRMLGDYEAAALNARVDYAFGNRANLVLSYTKLTEDRAFFGSRSLVGDDFGKGTVSESATIAADAMIGDTLQFFGTATLAESRSDKNALLKLDAVKSTAWQLGFAKAGVFGSTDNLRFSVAQPLQVENGSVEFKTVAVVDRETGEKGIVTQRLDIAEPLDRRFRIEAHYGASMLEGAADVALFSTYEIRDVRSDVARFTIGGKIRIGF